MNILKKVIEIEKKMSRFEDVQYKTLSSRKKIREHLIDVLGNQKPLHLVNIICPGYQKERTLGIEDFAFKRLSTDIMECPNVISMIDKLEKYVTRLGQDIPEISICSTVIFADTAILNYKEMQKVQNIRKVLDKFYVSTKKYLKNKQETNRYFEEIRLVKMSKMDGYFKNLKLGGYPVTLDMYGMENIRESVREKAKEYIGNLIDERTSKNNAGSSFEIKTHHQISKQSKLEVLRFLYEYGFAGKEIYNSIPHSILTFTEPSGPMRGFFYNSFLYGKDYLPVIYFP